jgi:hypothetical protein
MHNRRLMLAAAATLLLAGCGHAARPKLIKFLPAGESYADKPDLARVELRLPLDSAQRLELTPQNLATLSQEELDQLYARLTAGPIPDGAYEGTYFFPQGGGPEQLARTLGGARGLAAHIELAQITWLGEKLWKGKVFYRDKMELRNLIEHQGEIAKLFGVKEADMRTTLHDGKRVALLFPAKLYCGQSLLDSRRESVIIDYAFGDEIDGYLAGVDQIAGRNGLQVRDEIRRIRPGFYLGRAYMGRILLLDFTLYNAAEAERGMAALKAGTDREEDCWPGNQGAPVARSAH